MDILVIVNDPKDWPISMEGIEVVPARKYLTDARYARIRKAKLFNLCRSYRYQNMGYYVSLLAAARGHQPLPDISTIQDFKSPAIVRIASEDIDTLIQQSLRHLKNTEFTLSIYFGRNLAKTYDRLSHQLFSLFQAPFLRASFVWNARSGKWYLNTIGPIAAREIPEEHFAFVVQTARDFFMNRRRIVRKRTKHRFDLAILQNPYEDVPPSCPRALKKFVKAAEAVGFATEFITKDDYGRLAEFDALFIRETTNVNHYTYRFARRAAAKGIVVIDDPQSILKCTNKVFLAELLQQHKIPAPNTMMVDREGYRKLLRHMELPCILKQPDSSFSQGVVKAETGEDLKKEAEQLLDKSDMIIAQEFLPTDFDWRVGIINHQPLFVCKYFMAKKHWQIIKRNSQGQITDDGDVESLPVEFAPRDLIRTALRATRLIGDGLYGVDIKQVGNKFVVIEINDNPNVDAGIEDTVLKDELYLRIMRVMMSRVEQRKHAGMYA
jgi:glutathione synthase/RimK-type ligase-like ATP-grasp enzyme